MILWHHKTTDETKQGYQDANNAWLQSVQDQEEVEKLRTQVEEVVQAHLKLQKDNHFAQRLAAAYRGEYL
jgi:phosphoenolpyruvate-protein kinase (PTS system EI component)